MHSPKQTRIRGGEHNILPGGRGGYISPSICRQPGPGSRGPYGAGCTSPNQGRSSAGPFCENVPGPDNLWPRLRGAHQQLGLRPGNKLMSSAAERRDSPF